MMSACSSICPNDFCVFFRLCALNSKNTSKEKPRPKVWYLKVLFIWNQLESFRNESVSFKISIVSYGLETCFSFKSFKNLIYLPTIVGISEKFDIFHIAWLSFGITSGEQRTTPLHSITGTAGSTGVLNESASLPKPISDVEVECSPIEEVTIPLAVARSLKNIRKTAGKILLKLKVNMFSIR